MQNVLAQTLLQCTAERRRIAAAKLLLHIRHFDLRQCAAVVAVFHRIERVDAFARLIHALDRRRRRPEHDQRPFLHTAVNSDLARMIARSILRFVGMLLLLIDEDHAKLPDRRKDRRARADDHTGRARLDSPPLVIALAHAKRAVEHGDLLSKV